jgi:hypothetical protein
MDSLVSLISERFILDLNKKLGASAVIALKRKEKIVTGATAKSIRVESKRSEDSIESKVYGGAGMKFIVQGKKANTRLPVRKVGDRWELVQELKDWKAVKGLDIPDFLLARGIAKNKRDPVDMASETLTVFKELYGKSINNNLLAFMSSKLGAEFKEI